MASGGDPQPAGALPSGENAVAAGAGGEYREVNFEKLNKKDLVSMVHNQALQLRELQSFKDELGALKTMLQEFQSIKDELANLRTVLWELQPLVMDSIPGSWSLEPI